MLSEKRPRDIHSPGSSPRPHKVPNTATFAVAVTATAADSSTSTTANINNNNVILNDHSSMDAFLAYAASLRQAADAGIGATASSPVATTAPLPTPLSVEELIEIRGRALAAAQAALQQFNERRTIVPATAEEQLREASLKVWRAHEDVEAKQARMGLIAETQMDVDG